MRPLYRLVPRQEHLDDLVVVVVSGEDEGRNVRGELTLLFCPEERVAHTLPTYLYRMYIVVICHSKYTVKGMPVCYSHMIKLKK